MLKAFTDRSVKTAGCPLSVINKTTVICRAIYALRMCDLPGVMTSCASDVTNILLLPFCTSSLSDIRQSENSDCRTGSGGNRQVDAITDLHVT